jgi:hypothetical protein
LKKSKSSKILIFLLALSTNASGHGSLYFSNKSCSIEPPLTPIRIEQPKSFAALTISFTLSFEPIFPGLILRQLAPASAASIALL